MFSHFATWLYFLSSLWRIADWLEMKYHCFALFATAASWPLPFELHYSLSLYLHDHRAHRHNNTCRHGRNENMAVHDDYRDMMHTTDILISRWIYQYVTTISGHDWLRLSLFLDYSAVSLIYWCRSVSSLQLSNFLFSISLHGVFVGFAFHYW